MSMWAAALHRPLGGRCIWLLGILAALLALATLSLAPFLPGHPSRGLPAARLSYAGQVASISRLPAGARGPASAALGAADPAFRVAAGPGGGLLAENPAQRLRSRFNSRGLHLERGNLRLDLSLREAGYGSALARVGSPAPVGRANRVSYSRPGLREWYANGPLGLEQGFTLARPPGGAAHSAGARGPLTLSIAALSSPGARVRTAADGKIIFSMPHGGAISYGDLLVSDARGHVIPSSLAVSGGRILLRIRDRGAVYPLQVDPLVQEGGALEAGAEALETRGGVPVDHAALGYSLAMSADGNTAILGAPDYGSFTGAAWVFTRSGGVWSVQAKLSAPDEGAVSCGEASEEECALGRSIAISADGNTALIGGPRQSSESGAAWVFNRSGTEWHLTQELQGGQEETAEGHFGRSVALSGDGRTAAVGATTDLSGRGAVWIFALSEPPDASAQWSQQGPKIGGGEESGTAYFGGSVALSGDGETLLVGGSYDNEGSGAAWLFTRSGSGASATWAQLGPKLTGGAEEVGKGHFGYGIALSAEGSTALVGARNDNSSVGAAWTFAVSPAEATWTQQGPKLTAGPGEPGEGKFGYSVGLSASGLTAVVGAPSNESGVGAAWVFARSSQSSPWPSGEELTSSREAESGGVAKPGRGRFGASVALRADGLTVLVGAPNENGEAGAAWVFSDPGLIPAVASVEPSSGDITGGTRVTIRGARLAGASSVEFGRIKASNVTQNADGSLTATAPRHSAGPVCVTVTTPLGVSEGGASCPRFTYLAAPRIELVSPHQGSTAGGTAVAIFGRRLLGVSSVSFGSVPAASFTAVSAEEVIAVTPAEPEGEVPVSITTAGGTAGSPYSQWFLFQPDLGGVLGFGGCGVALRSTRVSVNTHHRALFKLTWRGSGACRGTLRLRVKARVRVKIRGKMSTVTRLTTVGAAAFKIPSGSTRTVQLKLNATGRRLLRARRGHLTASVVIQASWAGTGAARAASVRLTQQRPRPRKHTR
jgi:IPT/TIG domain/FG-GAP repeat